MSQLLESDSVVVECVIMIDGTEFSINNSKVPVFFTDKATFLTLSDTEQSQGVIAVCKMMAEPDVNQLKSGSHGLILALDGLQDPGNLGTIIRTSAWFGASALLLGSGTVDYYNPKVVRSTAGGLEVVPHLTCDLNTALPEFVKQGWEVALLDLGDNALSMNEWNPAEKVILVIGNEGAGISDALRNQGHQKIFIEGHSNHVESLNAGVAASIGLYKIGSRK